MEFLDNLILSFFGFIDSLPPGKVVNYLNELEAVMLLILHLLVATLVYVLVYVVIVCIYTILGWLTKGYDNSEAKFFYKANFLSDDLFSYKSQITNQDNEANKLLTDLFKQLEDSKQQLEYANFAHFKDRANEFIQNSNRVLQQSTDALLKVRKTIEDRSFFPMGKNLYNMFVWVKSLFFKQYKTFYYDEFKPVGLLEGDEIIAEDILKKVSSIRESFRKLLSKVKTGHISVGSKLQKIKTKLLIKKGVFSIEKILWLGIFYMLSVCIYLFVYGIHVDSQMGGADYATKSFIQKAPKILGALALSLFFARIASFWFKQLTKYVLDEVDKFFILRKSLSAAVFVTIFLVFFKLFGYDAAPVIAALGIGGLAVALALRESLENLFSGIQAVLGKKFSPGDYVMIPDANIEGTVDSINWSYTSLINLKGDLLVVPNSKMNQSMVTNIGAGREQQGYDQVDPTKRQFVTVVNFSVAYESDLPKVEEAAGEAVAEFTKKEFGKVDADTDYKTRILVINYGDSGIDYIAILKGSGYAESRGKLKASFIKILHQKFKERKIEFPYPTRTVYLKKEQ